MEPALKGVISIGVVHGIESAAAFNMEPLLAARIESHAVRTPAVSITPVRKHGGMVGSVGFLEPERNRAVARREIARTRLDVFARPVERIGAVRMAEPVIAENRAAHCSMIRCAARNVGVAFEGVKGHKSQLR